MKIKNFIYYFACGVILLYFYESIVFSKEILQEVSATIFRIINIVFPSLFGFMVGCDFLVRTGLYKCVCIIFKPLAKVFNMPDEIFLVFILSCIGGYPVGLRLISQLYGDESISSKTAQQLICFCYCPSPSFIIGVVGIGIFNNIKVGLWVYFSILMANLIIAFVLCHISKPMIVSHDKKPTLSSENLILSVTECGKSMLVISAVIIFFSYIITLLDCMNFFNILRISNGNILLKSIFEVTCISNIIADYNLIPLITFIFSTGGLSIILQIFALNYKKISLKNFLIFRLPVATLTGLISFVVFKLVKFDILCDYTYSVHQNSSDYSILSSICIFFMIITIFFQKKTSISKKSML